MDIVYGKNPVMELLKSDGEVDKVFVNKETVDHVTARILKLCREQNIVVSYTMDKKLTEMTGTSKHQGIAATIAQTEYVSVEDILSYAEEMDEKPFVVILDGIEDPHNLGAIIRSANVAGAHGVIIPKRRSATVNSTVYKASAGAAAVTRIAKVTNLSQTIDMLKERGLWIFGAEADGDKFYYESDMTGAVGVVIGSEGFGMSKNIREKCDFLVKIPVMGEINSLNASVAAGILLFEVLRQKLTEN